MGMDIRIERMLEHPIKLVLGDICPGTTSGQMLETLEEAATISSAMRQILLDLF